MAQRKKTGGARKTAVTKKTRSKKSSAKSKKDGVLIDEILLILLIAVAVIVMISLFTELMGAFGEAASTMLLGVFGVSAYIVSAVVIIFSLWMLFSYEREYKAFKIIGILLLLLTVSSFFHILSGNEASAVKELYASGAGGNGGVIGGVFGNLLLAAVDKMGAYFILLALFIISVILCSGKTLFESISGMSSYMRKKKIADSEKERYRTERMKALEKEKEQELAFLREKGGRRRKNYNIKLGADEGYNPDLEKMPVLEAVSFSKREKIAADVPTAADVPDPYDGKATDDTKEKEYAYNDAGVEKAGTEINENKDEALTSYAYGDIDEGGNSEEEILPAKPEAAAESTSDTENPVPEEAVNIAEGKIEEEEYIFPPTSLLSDPVKITGGTSKAQVLANAKKLEETLKSFGVEAKVMQINRGPTVTRYELSPSQGVKVSKIVNLSNDIALNLAASGVRVEAPIPGKAAIGIEVPNSERRSVSFKEVIESEEFKNAGSKLSIGLGEDISGNVVVSDIASMPHLLIAGATGSGKSVCINTIITSILYKATPKEVKLILIDPKVVELSVYNGIPHLLIPVVTDPKKAAGALNGAVREMLMRYNIFAENNVRDIRSYNELKAAEGEEAFMSQMVIIIDELADLMMSSPKEVEDSICRLAQMARAAGIHIIIATQRPSVDVITGVIKANIPSRLAFSVSASVDSRTILDMTGAEKLIGKGDMLFSPMGTNKPVRIQGAFISDKEVESVVSFVKRDNKAYDKATVEKFTGAAKGEEEADNDEDEFFLQALELVVEKEKASVSMLQRQFRIGYNRAARLIDSLYARGMVGPEDGSKPRRVLMTKDELEEYKISSVQHIKDDEVF